MVKKAGGAKKTNYSVAELVAKAEKLVDQCQPELAAQFYERALQKEPTNTALLDAIGELSTELGNPERAVEAFQQSIQLAPAQNPSKWLYLAQLVPGDEAEKYLTQGVAVMLAELAQQADQTSDEARVIKKQICEAYCSLGELYMTDLCFEDDAEAKCEQYFLEAMKFDIGLPEPTQALANLRFTQHRTADEAGNADLADQRRDEAVQLMDETYRRLDEACTEDTMPSLEYRVCTGKLLIELEMYEKACDVLEGVMQEDDDNAELWFLVGTCYRAMDDLALALEFFQKCEKMLKKLQRELRDEFDLDAQLESVVETINELQHAIATRPAEDDDDDDDDDGGTGDEVESAQDGTDDVDMEE
jgi:tetratricopeptide (TPR) repeat protein